MIRESNRRNEVTSQASRFVGSIPENYDQKMAPHFMEDYAADLARRVAVRHPKSVLELAAGTGIATRALRDALPDDCDLVASDLNPPMLEVAQAKFKAGEHVRFEQVDATDLQFEDASFDVVTCQFGVMFFPDKVRSYKEVRRILKPGGGYVFNTWGSWEDNPHGRVVYEVTERFYPEDPPAFYKVPFSYHDADEIRESLLVARFTDVTVTPVSFRSKILSTARLAQGLVYGNPIVEEIANRGGDPEMIRDAVAKAIEYEIGSELALHALVVQASVE